MNDYITDQLLDSARNHYYDGNLKKSIHKILQYLEHCYDQEKRPDWPMWQYSTKEKTRPNCLRAEPQNVYRRIGRQKK